MNRSANFKIGAFIIIIGLVCISYIPSYATYYTIQSLNEPPLDLESPMMRLHGTPVLKLMRQVKKFNCLNMVNGS
jgi:hypothetical protein